MYGTNNIKKMKSRVILTNMIEIGCTADWLTIRKAGKSKLNQPTGAKYREREWGRTGMRSPSGGNMNFSNAKIRFSALKIFLKLFS